MTRIIKRSGATAQTKPSFDRAATQSLSLGDGRLRGRRTRILKGQEQQALRRAAAIVAQAEARAAELDRRSERAMRDESAADARAREVALMRVIADAELQRRKVVDRAREELSEVAIAIARRLLRRELELDPTAISAVVSDCLERLRHGRHILLRINPADADAVSRAVADLRCPGLVELCADAEIERGGCLASSDAGQVDGRIETQLAAIRQVLRVSGE